MIHSNQPYLIKTNTTFLILPLIVLLSYFFALDIFAGATMYDPSEEDDLLNLDDDNYAGF